MSKKTSPVEGSKRPRAIKELAAPTPAPPSVVNEAKPPAVQREMTPAENARNEAFRSRRAATPRAVRFRDVPTEGERARIGKREEDPGGVYVDGLTASTGMLEQEASVRLLNQVAKATGNGEVTADQMNIVAATMTEIGPQDGLEGVLVAELLTVHDAAMDCLRQAKGAPLYERRFNLSMGDRLLRTAATLAEVLSKKRHGGKQEVSVLHKHVHVHDGGQAIVAESVTTGGTGHVPGQ